MLTQPQLQVGCTESTLVTSSYSDSGCHHLICGSPACSRPISVIQPISWSTELYKYYLEIHFPPYIDYIESSLRCVQILLLVVWCSEWLLQAEPRTPVARVAWAGARATVPIYGTRGRPQTRVFLTHIAPPREKDRYAVSRNIYWGHGKHIVHGVGKVQNFLMLKQLVACVYHCAVEKWINSKFVLLCLSVQITRMMRHWRYSKRC